MKVKLLTHTPEPEKIVAMAAKLCYSPVGTDEIEEGLTAEGVDRFIQFLSDIGHESPIEHISFTFGVEGISRVLTHQLVRHRIASYSQQSQRYVRLDAFEYIIPPAIEANPEALKIYEEAMAQDQETYSRLAEILEEEAYHEMVKNGMSEKKAKRAAEKKGIEDARYVFPNACETKIVMTMNARTLAHFFNHRCCNRAQWEIRKMADMMLEQVKSVAPSLFAKAGPPCLGGTCPEKGMSCGKIKEVIARYSY